MPSISSLKRLRLILLVLCALFIGCESGSGGSSVDLGGGSTPPTQSPPPAAQTGSLTFQFIRAQTALTVPAGTVSLRFDLHSAPELEGPVLQTRSRPFASTIVLDEVPVAARSVLVTAVDAQGAPLLTARANLTVTIGGNVAVNLERFNEVTVKELLVTPPTAELTVGGTRQFSAMLRLSDGTTTAATGVVWSVTGNATIDDSGLLTGTAQGTASVQARFRTMTGSAAVTILPAPSLPVGLESLTLSSGTFNLSIGAKLTLTAVGSFSDQSSRRVDNLQDGLTYRTSNALVATVDDTGEVKALAAGDATIVAEVGTVSTSATVRVTASQPAPGPPANQPPVVILGPETLIVQGSPSALAMPEAIVTDDQASLAGGTLEVQLYSGGLRPATFDFAFPAASTLGTVSEQTVSVVRVSLSGSASPAAIQTALRGIVLRAIGASGDIGIYIKLTDSFGLTTEATKEFYVEGTTPINLTVNPAVPVSGTNFHDIQPAIDHVISNGAPGSIISVAPGHFFTGSPAQAGAALYYLGEARNLRNLFLRGAKFGQSSGVAPESRGPETVVRGFAFQESRNVIVDGFQVAPSARDHVGYGYRAHYTVANTRFVFGAATYWNYSQDNVSVTFQDCSFEGPATVAEELWAGAFTCTGCAFLGSYGPFVYDTPKITMTGNGFSGTNTGFGASFESYAGDPAAVDVHFNGNDVTSSRRVEVLGPYNIDMTGNWWGQASGPLAGQIGTTGTGQGLFSPFLTQDPFPTFP